MAREYEIRLGERRKELQERLNALNAIDSELLINRYLQPCRNPELHDPSIPQDSPEVPPLLHACIPESCCPGWRNFIPRPTSR